MFAFGLTAAFMTVIVMLLGDEVGAETAVTALGSGGLPTAFLLQLLAAVMTVAALRMLFLSDLLIKRMKPSLRVFFVLVTALLTMLAFILYFGWFPPRGLIVFVPCAVCILILNTVRLLRREEAKNRELADALDRYKSTHPA
jgi:hypothetical protein